MSTMAGTLYARIEKALEDSFLDDCKLPAVCHVTYVFMLYTYYTHILYIHIYVYIYTYLYRCKWIYVYI